jgi:two-component system chemotaxis sensor kinase CheA
VLFGSAPLEEQEEIAAGAEEQTEPTLLFRDLDGVERAVRLSIVERIEDVATSAASFTAGRIRLTHEGRIMPLMSCGVPIQGERMRILRMRDGEMQIAYAIDGVIDIIDHGALMEAAVAPGLVEGVALIEGRPVEFIDLHWLFSGAANEGRSASGAPICLLADGEDPWTRHVLRPLVEAAGYRVALVGEEAAERADIIIGGLEVLIPSEADVPVIRLRPRPESDGGKDDSIYRYDRIGLIEALRHRTAGGRGH